MARLKTFGNLSRKPNDASGSVKTPRKQGHGSAPLKSGLNKKKKKKPTTQVVKKPKQRKPVVREPTAAEEEEDAESAEDHLPVQVDDGLVEREAEEDEDVSSQDEDVIQEIEGAATKKKPKVYYSNRRLRRIAILQKSEARLATEKGFKRIVNHIQATSKTGSLNGAARFSRAALQNMQAAVESLLHKVLSNTAQQVYTITKRNARISAAPIAVTAGQNFLGMKGAQFINDYRDAREM